MINKLQGCRFVRFVTAGYDRNGQPRFQVEPSGPPLTAENVLNVSTSLNPGLTEEDLRAYVAQKVNRTESWIRISRMRNGDWTVRLRDPGIEW